MLQNIECSECKRLPLFDIDFENNKCSIIFKCHNKKFEDISLEKFKDFLQPIKCKECQKKYGNNICYCGLFCEDDYLSHFLLQSIIKLIFIKK